MLDPKDIAKRPDFYKERLIAKGAYKHDIDHWINVIENRVNTRKGWATRLDEQNALIKQNAKGPRDQDMGKLYAERARQAKAQLDRYDAEIQGYTQLLPNTPENPDWTDWATVGPDEADLPRHGMEHTEILGKNQLDFAAAAKIAGSRFAVLRGGIATFERHLANDMIDFNVQQGYEEVSVPLLVNKEAMYGTGQLPKFEDDLFKTTDDRYLIPTGEVPLTNLVADTIVDSTEAPIRLTTLTPCFRAEAGSAGRDTKGLIRQHQFYKAELVAICLPEQAEQELNWMMTTVSNMLHSLKLPFRIIRLPEDDLGFSAKLTYDFEVWFPGQKAWREVSSVSWCGDFQARRMNARFKRGTGKPEYLHTLNGSSLAVGRILAAIVENNYDSTAPAPTSV